MSDSDRDKKIDELLELIKKAPAMNGGFTKLQDSVGKIEEANTKVLYELQLVKSNQDVHIKKIDELHNALYEPDKGLYRRVSTALEDNKTQTVEINDVRETTKSLSQKLHNLEYRQKNIESKQATFESVAGKDLKDLRSAISTRKNMMRAFWAFSLGAIGGLAKFLWDVLPGLF